MARLQDLRRPIGARLLAAASLFVVGTLVPAPAAVLADGDPTWANNGYTDVTSSTLQVDLAYTDTSGTPQNVNLAMLSGALLQQAPAELQQALSDSDTRAMLNTPLGTYFDTQWNQPDPKTKVTPHDNACENLKNQAIAQVQQALDTTPADIGCNLATGGGSVGALVADGTLTMQVPDQWQEVPCCGDLPLYLVPGGQHVLLNYWLPGDSLTFHLPGKPFDPSYRLDFNAELEMVVDIGNSPCSDTVYSWSKLSDANLNETNQGASFDDWLAENFRSWNPQVTEGQVDSGTHPAGADGSVSKLFGELTSVCNSDSFGFSEFGAGIQNGALALTFTHPDIAKPQLADLVAQCEADNFIRNTVGLQQFQVHAGDSDAVTGHFDIPTGTALRVGWGTSSSCGGGVSSPDSASVRWGPEGGPTTTKPVSGDEFDPTGLSPNTTYTFQVQVCDAVTCSPWSDPLSLTTGAADSENVLLRLVPHGSNGQCKPQKINGNSQNGCIDVGSASLDAGGVLTTSVTVPPSTAAGEYDFEALRNGGSQTVTAPMPLTVIKQGIQPPAVLSGWDASANRPIASAQAAQGGSLTLHGESFVPGSVSLTLDSANGKVFGQAQAGLDGTFLGTFSLPYTSVGKHTLVASGAGGSRATFEIYVESSVQ